MFFAVSHSFAFDKNQVAVTLGRGLFGGHLGVAFHTATEGPKVLHLRFHKDLQVDPFTNSEHIWIGCVVDLPKIASASLVGILRGLAKKRPNIGYGLNFIVGKGSFADNGSYKAPKGSDGFTCSTLITELFRKAALPLIDETTWQTDPSNLAWGNAVCCLLEALHPLEIDHLNAVKKNNIGLRIRPEEVAAAADLPFSIRPVGFAIARQNAQGVFGLLDSVSLLSDPPPHLKHCVEIYEQGQSA